MAQNKHSFLETFSIIQPDQKVCKLHNNNNSYPFAIVIRPSAPRLKSIDCINLNIDQLQLSEEALGIPSKDKADTNYYPS